MGKSQYRINRKGYGEVLNDRHTQQECLSMAQYIGFAAQAMGGGPYRCDVRPGLTRAHARATTDGRGAYFKELKTHALSRSIPRKGQKRK